MLLYRNGSDNEGDILAAKITFRHMKGASFVVNQSNHAFIRTLTSPSQGHEYLDLPLFLMCLATLRGFAKIPVNEWYTSGLTVFAIKEESLDIPLICASESGGG